SDNYEENLSNYLQRFPAFVSYTDNVNDAYFTASFLVSYEFNLFNSLTASKIFFQVNNLFDNLYSANAIGGEFFPAADRSFYFGLNIGL
ncbi:MAG: TonB-dependent receptor, partial [Bacteroidetes bacterium]|nr:TonB-dependent receptor [Bacteroidota bacterium]